MFAYWAGALAVLLGLHALDEEIVGTGWLFIFAMLLATVGALRPLDELDRRWRWPVLAMLVGVATIAFAHSADWLLGYARLLNGAEQGTTVQRLVAALTSFLCYVAGAWLVVRLFVRPIGEAAARVLGAAALAAAVYALWPTVTSLTDWAEKPARQVLRLSVHAVAVLATVEFARRARRRPGRRWLPLRPVSRVAALIAFPLVLAAFWSIAYTQVSSMVGLADGWSEFHVLLFMTSLMLASIAAVPWAWRATEPTPGRLRPYGRVFVGVTGGLTCLVIAVHAGPIYGSCAENVALAHSQRPDSLVIADGARPGELRISGEITFGYAEKVVAAVLARPDLTSLVLEGPGGLATEALTLADYVRAWQLETRVTESCESACTLVFIAGTRRVLEGEGRLGFHAASSASPLAQVDPAEDVEDVAQFGIDRAFAERAAAVPAEDMWYPTHDELRQAHVVTDIQSPK
jgi:hypothetical protein